MSLRVLLLTQWFEPEPTFKGLAFAKQLKDLGLEVEVVTGFPNYPVGKLYPGYRIRLIQHEWIDGIHITRVPLYPSHDRSILRRIANYVSFAISAFIYCVFMPRHVDVVYAYHPPLSVGAVAVALKFCRRWRVVLDIQDLWPDTLRATGMLNNARILGFIGCVAGLIYKWSDHVVVLSEGFRNRLLERGVPAEKIDVIKNWANEQKLAQKDDAIDFCEGGRAFNILFAGNMGSAQALDTVLDAAELLQTGKSSVRFVMLGTGLEVPRLQAEAIARGLKNIKFLPSVPMSAVGSYLRAADALLVHLRDDELFEITIPSKTQAYMASGKPILMAVKGDAAALVQEAACGLLAEPQNARSLAIAAEELANTAPASLAAMGRRGREYYDTHLSLKVGASKFKSVFERVIPKK